MCNLRKVSAGNIYAFIYAFQIASTILKIVCFVLPSRLGQGGYKGKAPAAEESQDYVETPEPELEDSGRRLRNRRGKPSK